MNDDAKRLSKYAKDNTVESVLNQLNVDLVESEHRFVSAFDTPIFPTVFIVGVQRSGTTLLLQLLLKYAQFGYVSNLISRFWKAPYIGTVFARSLLKQGQSNVNLQSDLGYTSGYEGPHEFGYFWRKWFPEATLEGHGPPDKSFLVKTLAAMEHEWQASMIFKNLLTCSFVIQELAELFPKSIFIYIERDLFFTAQSTYLSRIKLFGSPDVWFGLKPPEFNELQKLTSPFDQIAGQLFFSKTHIEESLSKIPQAQKIILTYKELTKQPQLIIDSIIEVLRANKAKFHLNDWNPAVLKHTDKIKVNPAEKKLIDTALKKYNF